MDENQYQAKEWVDSESEGTPITYMDLNRMDKGIDQIYKVLSSHQHYVIYQPVSSKPTMGVFLDVYGKIGIIRFNLSGSYSGSDNYITVGTIPHDFKVLYDTSEFKGHYFSLVNNTGNALGFIDSETGEIKYRVLSNCIYIVGSTTVVFE